MEIVVDTNFIISALLKNGVTRKILFLAPFEFYSLSYARSEIEKHKKELIRKSKLEEPYKNKAIEIMTDIDISDAPFIALALHLDCSIWSNDGHFKKQHHVKVYSTEGIKELLQESTGRELS